MKYIIKFIGAWRKSIEKINRNCVKEVLALNKEEAIQILDTYYDYEIINIISISELKI